MTTDPNEPTATEPEPTTEPEPAQPPDTDFRFDETGFDGFPADVGRTDDPRFRIKR